ncbi:MAG TPA: methyltransferase domain-containing protein [Bryobacteraceae bacterium]|jgi:SAM-dependent methyltransferase|nr:methyltransferase domain-containing protein [Bryobacteraceae bacterium]
MIRSLEPELMDNPGIEGPILDKFHRDLNRVHRLLGSYPTIERFIRKDKQPVRSVIDIGCGGGALLDYLRRRLQVEVTGIDQKPGTASDIPIIAANAITDPLPSADVAVSSFVSHHLSPEENIALIRNVSRSCRRFIILDLIRHPMPLWLFTIFICPLIGREAAVDGRQSVRRAYTPDEFKEMARTAIEGTNATLATDVSPLLSRQVIDIHFA